MLLCSSAGDGFIAWIKPTTGKVPYDKLPPCAKFVLNSCRAANGEVNEEGCGSINPEPDGSRSYRGLMYTAGCESARCLCKGGNSIIHGNYLLQAGLTYCNYPPTTSDYNSTESDDLQGAYANYCKENGVPLTDYLNLVVGETGSKMFVASALGMFNIARSFRDLDRPMTASRQSTTDLMCSDEHGRDRGGYLCHRILPRGVGGSMVR